MLLALAAYLWVNRTPSPNERFDEHGRVPLFGVDLVAAAAATVSAEAPSAPMSRGSTVRSAPISDLSDDPDIAEVEEAVIQSPSRPAQVSSFEPPRREPVRPVGKPILIDTSAVDATAPAADEEAQPETTAPPAANGNGRPELVRDRDVSMNGDADHTGSARNDGNFVNRQESRLGGVGWRAGGGWPTADQKATPRFAPPVREGTPTTPRSNPVTSQGETNGSSGSNVFADGVPGSYVEGHRIRFSTPMEGTLQFLPGRLEISSGLDTGREIRFVRVPGPNGTEVTFGRNEGPLYRHIQLRDQTVSREHARMTLADGRWLLTNLSQTNPVAHNGRVLSPGEHQPLEDGDRLEMGEVIFSFRSR